jgi:hypothetical protein
MSEHHHHCMAHERYRPLYKWNQIGNQGSRKEPIGSRWPPTQSLPDSRNGLLSTVDAKTSARLLHFWQNHRDGAPGYSAPPFSCSARRTDLLIPKLLNAFKGSEKRITEPARLVTMAFRCMQVVSHPHHQSCIVTYLFHDAQLPWIVSAQEMLSLIAYGSELS